MFNIYKSENTSSTSLELKILKNILDFEDIKYKVINENRKTRLKGESNYPVVVIKETEEVIAKNYKELVNYLDKNGLCYC